MPPSDSPTASPIPPSREQDRPRFQFSLRSQLIAVTAVAVLLGLYVVAPRFFTILLGALVYWVLPAPLLAGAVYGRDETRAFSIGGLIPWVPVWVGGGQPFVYAMWYGQANFPAWVPVVAAVLTVAASGACGVLVVATRRWFERHRD
jgi:hypothetical protein